MDMPIVSFFLDTRESTERHPTILPSLISIYAGPSRPFGRQRAQGFPPVHEEMPKVLQEAGPRCWFSPRGVAGYTEPREAL
jgi:hypothetical protein